METKPAKRANRKRNSLSPYWTTPFDRYFRTGFPDVWDDGDVETIPSMNFREEKNNYIIDMAAPGLKKEDFEISLEGNLLTVSSSKTSEEKEEDKEGFSRREYSYSSFSRSVTLPEQADSKKITAKYTDGILSMTIPKKADAGNSSSQKIKVE
jgi:HSP20 family protein